MKPEEIEDGKTYLVNWIGRIAERKVLEQSENYIIYIQKTCLVGIHAEKKEDFAARVIKEITND